MTDYLFWFVSWVCVHKISLNKLIDMEILQTNVGGHIP